MIQILKSRQLSLHRRTVDGHKFVFIFDPENPDMTTVSWGDGYSFCGSRGECVLTSRVVCCGA